MAPELTSRTRKPRALSSASCAAKLYRVGKCSPPVTSPRVALPTFTTTVRRAGSFRTVINPSFLQHRDRCGALRPAAESTHPKPGSAAYFRGESIRIWACSDKKLSLFRSPQKNSLDAKSAISLNVKGDFIRHTWQSHLSPAALDAASAAEAAAHSTTILAAYRRRLLRRRNPLKSYDSSMLFKVLVEPASVTLMPTLTGAASTLQGELL